MDKSATVPFDHRYGTHLPLLTEFALRTYGPVLEVGAGWYSTPVLHALCARHQRLLVTVETDPAWLERYEHLKTPWHVIGPEPPSLDWFELALIDGPEQTRVKWIDEWHDRVRYLILHDADPGHKYPTDYFQFTRVDKRLAPWSMVVSHFSSVEADCGCGGQSHSH